MSSIEIGTQVEAVVAAKEAIIEILNAHADQKTIRAALGAFVESIQPKNIVVSACSFGVEAQKQDTQ
jgi:hypothetical protein